ncbi:helix-turn-helix transcriptional regulator [Paenibacillus sp. SYP-B3998]|uniref:Helix-turn-helix transcriptional regulator n=1 Tax=Paenibacillus sp. SYP-B3998 TaxID=2678564 RepID=A0A6G4A2H7_9BACL|nr:helix-turn-helix domain-containing protein [Paenibacillus sp. SYP-B3998]NEW08585.1 helix-turn-helix transcriptional regulator [Paenibacillus sp. SYP-B3998]
MKLDTAQAAFSQLLISGTLIHEADFDDMRERLGIESCPQLVIVLSIDRYTDLAMNKSLPWSIEIGQQLVQAIYESFAAPFLWVWVGEGVLALLLEVRAGGQPDPSYKQIMVRMVKKLQHQVDRKGFSVSAGIGTYYDDPYKLHLSYGEAKESLIDRFFQGNRMIFQYEQQRNIHEERTEPVSQEEKIELLSRVRIGDEDGSIAYLAVLLERLAGVYKHNVDRFKSEAYDLILSLSRMVVDLGGNASEILSDNARMLQNLYSTIRYDKFVLKLSSYWRKLARQVADDHALEVSPVIRSAIVYIKEHHQEKMLLTEIAQRCYLSTHYFAHLFKKETGLSFVDFLNKVRIEKSAYFLEKTELSVQEIAAHVGIQDANYFARKFKMIMGCSPTDYRSSAQC